MGGAFGKLSEEAFIEVLDARQNSSPSRGTNPPNGGLFSETAATKPDCAGAGSGDRGAACRNQNNALSKRPRAHLTQHCGGRPECAPPHAPSPTGPRHGAGIRPPGKRHGLSGHVRARLAPVLYSDVHSPVSPCALLERNRNGTKRRDVERTEPESGRSEVGFKEGKRNGTRNGARYCFSAKKPLICTFGVKVACNMARCVSHLLITQGGTTRKGLTGSSESRFVRW